MVQLLRFLPALMLALGLVVGFPVSTPASPVTPTEAVAHHPVTPVKPVKPVKSTMRAKQTRTVTPVVKRAVASRPVVVAHPVARTAAAAHTTIVPVAPTTPTKPVKQVAFTTTGNNVVSMWTIHAGLEIHGQGGNVPAHTPVISGTVETLTVTPVSADADTGASVSTETLTAAPVAPETASEPVPVAVASTTTNDTTIAAAVGNDSAAVVAAEQPLDVPMTAGDPPPPGDEPAPWGPGSPDWDSRFTVA